MGGFLGGGPPVIGDDHALDKGVEFELVEAVARCLAHPADTLGGACRGEGGEPDCASGGLAEAGEPDDVRLAPGQLQHAAVVAADEERRVRLLHRRWDGGVLATW